MSKKITQFNMKYDVSDRLDHLTNLLHQLISIFKSVLNEVLVRDFGEVRPPPQSPFGK